MSIRRGLFNREKQNLSHRSDDRLRILDDLPGMTWCAGPDARSSYFNQSWLNFTGLTLETALENDWAELIHPEDSERVSKAFYEAFYSREPYSLDYRLRHASGEYCWVQDSGHPTTDDEGQFTGFISTCTDLTERKQMEKALLESNQALEAVNSALRESEMMFKRMFEYAPDAVVAVDERGRILLANQLAQSMFGYAHEEMIGQPIEMLMPESFQTRHRKQVSSFVKDPRHRPMGEQMSLFGRRKNGDEFPVDINLGPLTTGSQAMILATIRDISERKKRDEAIREREKLLTTAAMSAPIVFFKIDRDGLIQFSLGQSLSRRRDGVEPVGRSIYEAYSDLPGAIESYQRAMSGEVVNTVIEADGITYEVSYSPLQAEDGHITGVVGVAFNVTRHREVEGALRESEAHFHTIFQDTILSICLVDAQGQIIEANPAFESMLGYSGEELYNRNLFELIHPSDAALTRNQFAGLISGENEHFRLEQRYIGKEGRVLWGRLAMSMFRGTGDRPGYAIGMIENITAQKQAEAELAELQRRLIDSAEVERLNLAQDLHDGPLQDIQGMSFQIATLQTMIQDANAISELEVLEEELHKVSRSIRALCGDLRPPALAPFGLENAIRAHADQFQEQHPEIRVHLDLMQDGQALSERLRLALFRIYQHSMTNILRHSKAKNVWVTLKLESEQVNMTIKDDGAGFKVPSRWIELVRQGHFGLVGSIERAESVGGKLEIQSSPGSGVTINVRAPRREEEQVAIRERFSITPPDGQ